MINYQRTITVKMSYNYKDCSCHKKKHRRHRHSEKPAEKPPAEVVPRVNFSAPEGAGPVVQSVRGSGHFSDSEGQLRTFTFAARRHEDGRVSGEWQRIARSGDFEGVAHGNITCFTIEDGNKARLGGFAQSGPLSTAPNNGVGWRVVDNGQGANGAPDQISLQFIGLSPEIVEPYCDWVFGDFPPLLDVQLGNIQVAAK